MASIGVTQQARAVLARVDPHEHIQTLTKEAQTRMTLLVFGLVMLGYGRILCTYGKRPLPEQQMLFGRGRSVAELNKAHVPAAYAEPTMKKVTWCLPEDSKHVKGEAVDFNVSCYISGGFPGVKELCNSLRITWGGVWEVKDYGHFELK